MTQTFLTPPIHYAIAEFRAHLAGLALGEWRPSFPTLHNTGVPSLAQWLAMGATPQERWAGNLNHYYEGMGWHAGPHLVVCPDYVWALCDLTKSGVSVSCWNSETFGIEMVGNYEVGGDDFASGDGAKVRDNAAAVLAALNEKFRWGDLGDFALGARGLHFHHDCARDHHACPGSKVTKPDLLARIRRCEAEFAGAPIPLASPPIVVSSATVREHDVTPPKIMSVDDIQAALNRLGAKPALAVDGRYGDDTHRCVEDFQRDHRCFVDGWAGAQTCAAIEAALSQPAQET
jgi:Putative peptidoglycan binding domain/N-acetylmuramoyl-L-alanine amidase